MRLFLLVGFFTLYLLGITKDSYATHAAGIDMSYVKVVGSTNSYEFLIRFYRDCGDANTSTNSEPNNFQLCYTSPCTGTISSITCNKVVGNIASNPSVPNGTSLTNGCNAATTCTNINSSIHGYRQWWYKGTVTLPVTCNYWRFWVTFCCRNAGTSNIGPLAANNYNIYCEATFNNAVSQNNNSPYFLYTSTPSTLPVPYCCINVPYYHFGGAQDSNGDSLTFHTVYPSQINSTNCNATTPQTILATNGIPAYNILNTNGNPLQTNNSYLLDTTTGYFSFTPAQLGHWTLCQRVDEYRNGVWLGSTMRDMYLVVDQCVPLPVVSSLDSLSVTGGSSNGDTVFSCPNQPIHFCMNIIDNANTAAWVSHVFDNHSSAFPNSSLTWTKPDTNILRVCVDWIPTLADTGLHTLYVNVTDSLDCLITPAMVQLPVVVRYGLIAYGDTSVCAGIGIPLSTNLNSTVSWSALPGGSGNGSLSCLNCPNPIASPSANTSYVATDNACGYMDTVVVSILPSPTLTITPPSPSICVGQSVSLQVTGASSYVWANNSSTNPTINVSPAVTTTYTITGTNTNGCSTTSTVTVVVNPWPIVNATATPPAICTGSSSTLNATGATNYIWQPGGLIGSPVVNPTTTTIYTVTGTNGNGCSNTTTVTVTVYPLPFLTTNASPSTICIGDSSALTINGATNYLWQPGGLTGSTLVVSPTTTTTYTVTGTNLNGCTNTTTLTVIVNPLPNVSASAAPAAICLGTISQLTATGAANYLWQPGGLSGSPVVSPTTTTQYTVTGTNANGCTNTYTVNLSVNPLPIVFAGATPAIICLGESSTLSATGANTYSWQPGGLSGSPTVSPITTTTYTVTGTNAFGCTATATITITVNPLPNIIANATPSGICIGDSATLSASGASTYLWQPGGMNSNPIVNPIVTTTYTVTGTSTNGCSNTSVVSVLVNLNPNVIAAASPNIICTGASSTLSATGSANYVWQPGGLIGNPLVSPMVTTTYTVTGTNSSGCSNTSMVTIYVNPLIISATSSPNSICLGSTSTLNANGGNSYTWQPGNLTGSPVVSPTTSTTYTVTGSTTNGCSNTAIVSVLVNPPPVITVKNIEYPICSTTGNYSFDADGSSLAGIQEYTLQPGNQTNSTGIFSQLYAGQFTVTVTDNYSCTNSTVVTLPSPDLIDLTSVKVNDDSCYFNINNKVTGIVNGGVAPKVFYVVPGGMTNDDGIFLNLDPDQYYMVVTDSNGCSDTQPFEVRDHQCCSEPYVASAFSPNHDGINDELHCIHFYGLTIEKFMIVNRYGNVVFKAQNDQDSWDGTYHGSPCDVGTYFYMVRYKCEETNEEGILKGDVSLIR